MDTCDKWCLGIVLLALAMLAMSGVCGAIDGNRRLDDIEKRVLVLETKMAIYEGHPQGS